MPCFVLRDVLSDHKNGIRMMLPALIMPSQRNAGKIVWMGKLRFILRWPPT
jgi:hypothetical protein